MISCITDLPDETMLRILSKLSARDLNKVAACCRRFRTLTGDKVLWEGLLEKWQGFDFYVVNTYTQKDISFFYRYPNDETGKITFIELYKSLKSLAKMVDFDALQNVDYISVDTVRGIRSVISAKVALCAMDLLSVENARDSICKAIQIAKVAEPEVFHFKGERVILAKIAHQPGEKIKQ